jgi:hypothetical protein
MAVTFAVSPVEPAKTSLIERHEPDELAPDQASAGAVRREYSETPDVLWGCDTNHATSGDPFR